MRRESALFETPGPLLFLPLLLIQGGGMDLSRVGEKLLSSVRSARSLGLLPSPSDRPEVFDPVRYILDNIPSEEDDVAYLDKQSTLRLAQLDKIAERLSRHVMEHHEEMVKGMQLVMELEQDLKVANVICMNGRRHIASSKYEVSRDLVVNTKSKKKRALLDMLPILTELRHALDMQMELESLVESGNYYRAFQLLPEYLQVLDNYSELSAVQEMGRGVEAWLVRTIQKLDSHLLGVCQTFKEESYITAVDAYALMGDIGGMAEKIQSFFLQEVLSQTHLVLKDMVQEETGNSLQINRLTYSDLCVQIHESKFRQCLLKTLEALFKLMCSYYSIMSFQPEEMDFESETSNTELKQNTVSHNSEGTLVGSGAGVFSDSGVQNGFICESVVTNDKFDESSSKGITPLKSSSLHTEASAFNTMESSSDSPFYQLRKEATAFVAHALERGRRNLWQLSTSRVTVLLSCSAVCSTSTHQFLRNCEDLNIFILAGEAFCGVEAVEFRQKLKIVCENYIVTFHRQNALKMVLEKESWVKMSAEAPQVISLAGLTGDGAPLVVSSLGSTSAMSPSYRRNYDDSGKRKNGFAYWLKTENPFSSKLEYGLKESPKGRLSVNGSDGPILDGGMQNNRTPEQVHSPNRGYGSSSILEDENEDLLADFIDEDSQLPSRISKPRVVRSNSAHWNDEEISAQTGSSLCLLRASTSYLAYFITTSLRHLGSTTETRMANRLKTALSKITQDCDQWIRPQSASSLISSPLSLNSTLTQMDIMPTVPPSTLFSHVPNTSFGLKERCAATETISLVSRVLNRSKPHLQSMLSQNNSAILEDFFRNLVDSVPDLIEHINRTSARALLHINGYADKIAGAKWEVKELGLEHNGYVDLLLGEFKHYKTRLVHGGIPNEVQDLLLEYGLENIAEVLIEGLSRVKRCTDEGRVLMSLDLQVLINGLQHFVSVNVKPKLQIVETFIKEYTKSQIVGLVNLVANMKGWKRKTRLEVLERIETGS
ncbi:Syndetin [Ananas comosus]|uniref:Syndetin n=1 Tax=Ananas comosus TaxID=4615 RepID=A0A199W5H8_ANACO|nr:Syndetin [Ananas comosus]